MKTRWLLSCALVGTCLLAVLGTARAAEKKPDATIHLSSKSVAAGVGFSWGKGTLKFQGKEYELSVDGLTVGSVGVSEVTATGEVFDLKKLEDFDGTYTAVTGGGSLGGGGGGLVMENQNGVKVRMKATAQGVSLTAGVSGVKLAIKR